MQSSMKGLNESDRELRLKKIALSFVKGMTADIARHIRESGLSLDKFFSLSMPELSRELGCGDRLRFEDIGRQEALFRARRELDFVERHNIHTYSLLDDDYPMLLGEIPDAPVMLYKLGDADLDSGQIMNIVGTRQSTPYGLGFCRNIVEELAAYFPTLKVVSGLAYGIDAAAHQASLDNGVVTVAVVAHGLDTIYPSAHRDLARKIVGSGGAIVSEYPSGTKGLRQHFLARNRIIAGLSELTVVAESEIKGGAMSTANSAFMYDREVMALPGRISDIKSSGCNHLIRKQKAHLVTCAADIIELMDWRPMDIKVTARQRNLFPELQGEASKIYDVLRGEPDPVQIDRIHQLTGLSVQVLLSTLSELEFDGIAVKYPGNRYTIA